MAEDSDTERNDSAGRLEEQKEHKLRILTFRMKRTNEGDRKPFLIHWNTVKITTRDRSAAQFDYGTLN